MNNSEQISDVTSAVSATEVELEEKLISATDDRLEKVFNGESLSTPKSAEEFKTSSLASAVESAATSTPESAVSSLAEGQSSLAESVASETPADKTPGLPDAYFRAAIHQDWTPDEIKDLYLKDPELALKTFKKLYASTNKLSSDFAAIGRAKQKSQQDIQSEPDKTKDKPKKPEFKSVDIEKLRKQYDNDPIVEIIDQMQQQNKIMFDKLNQTVDKPISEQPQINEQQIRVKVQEEALLEQQIDQFFKSDDLKLYSGFYGTLPKGVNSWDAITVDQRTNRWKLLEEADAIIIGAESQGRKMTVNEAMNLAHLQISEPMREKAIRDDIKANVVKRSKSLSLKPTGTKSVGNSKPQTPADLEAKTTERLAKVFK